MTNIGIVGTSYLEPVEEDRVKQFIEDVVRGNPDCKIVTGDAETGVDYLVRMWTPRHMLRVHGSIVKNWGESGGFKDRNIKIAEDADIIYSITTKTKNTPCFHCNQAHQRTGGCWTLKYAKEKLGKNGEVLIV
jgi:hypothetical protein